MIKITVGIPTKDRYNSLDKTLLSIAFQTLKPVEVIIVDDSPNPVDIREIPHYNYILRLFDDKGIKWKVLFGQKKGQHYSHQLIQEIAEGDWIFRIDDDEVAEPDCLETLSFGLIDGVGAIAPLVLMPNPEPLPRGLTNSIEDFDKPNIQWFRWKGAKVVDHLYSCFIYRKGLVDYELSLSPVCHREETIFSHKLKRAGHEIFVNADATVWHFREEKGGIRSYHDHSLWDHDEKIFRGLLNLWGVTSNEKKFVVLDNGLGDHYAFKNILKELKNKYRKIVIACCFPDVFHDESGLELISIAEAKLIFGNIDTFNIYKFMEDNKWSKSITEAFKALYANHNQPIQPEVKKREGKSKKLPQVEGFISIT